MNRGFTLVELVVSIGIFAAMTALVVVKYGNFNQSTLFTDTAYNIALAVHTAQVYGLSVRNVSSSGFSSAYGVDLAYGSGANTCGSIAVNSQAFALYADGISAAAPNGICDGSDSSITTYTITQGAYISALCVGSQSSSCSSVSRLDVTYLRPNPEATICGDGTCSGQVYAKVTITAADGSTRSVEIRHNGQISVLQQ